MSTGLNTDNQTVVSAFHAALLHQTLVILAILAVVGVAWNVLRGAQLRQALAAGDTAAGASGASARVPGLGAWRAPEPTARRLLRIGFGLLWIFDGVLQGQSSMPLGMGPDVIQPAVSGSPGWLQHLVNAAVTIWSYHPVTAAAATVWIQVGIGLWLLVAPRGTWSRLGAMVSVEWSLVVWVFGEALGGMLAPGPSWLFGSPGAIVFYAAAGVLLALPESAWTTPRLGRTVLRLVGVLFLGMAVLQAWPDAGFWQGRTASGAAGPLTAMAQQMAQTPQPHFLASWLSAFAGFAAGHGWAVNLVVVVALAATGLLFVSGRPAALRVGVGGAAVLCLVTWVLVQDLGFLGGVGTDPNSMVPMLLLIVGAAVAMVRLPAQADDVVVPLVAPTKATAPGSLRARLLADPTYTFRAVAAVASLAIVVVGAAPMAAAAAEPHADSVVAEAVNGGPQAVDAAAPPFSLVDQGDRRVSLASLHGKTVVLTFLDPVCTSDCPLIAQEMRTADAMLGSGADRVAFLAIDANPVDTAVSYLQAFDRQEGLDKLPNWHYLTGPLPQLEQAWDSFGAQVSFEPGGGMIDHSDLVELVNARGRLRYVLDADPGPGTQASESSFASVVVSAVHLTMASA